ncbi:hypothetical protein K431DRAFT_237093 [Polychaeton citri CBS 116435]|uniref:Protein BNI4 n=1 Tax=Polychaeton citri CBS 116435 TaxID=1314669 RepID=A0A9P4QGV5_9PEZI|nr:hypothetical protein K431DRAFT_237093 [Polychaeton citri CBS 116435]
MAEVLPPLMQSSSSMPMLHSRPSSSDYQSTSQQFSQSPRLGQSPRSMYNGSGNSYRGVHSAVQPYAFNQAPSLRQETRSLSHGAVGTHRHTQSTSDSAASSSDTSSQPSTKDDSVLGSRQSSFVNFASQLPDLTLTPLTPLTPVDSATQKQLPGRYRRPNQQRSDSVNSVNKASSPKTETPPSFMPNELIKTDSLEQQKSRQSSVDDTSMPKAGSSELAKRYRRRSMNSLETQTAAAPQPLNTQRPTSAHGPSATSTPTTIRPVFAHQRTASGSSQNGGVQVQDSGNPATTSQAKPASIPPRVSSADANKRMANPSPLSKNALDSEHMSPAKPKASNPAVGGSSIPSPAAQQLAAVSDKDLNKGMKSRLRRAFSFGSAQELRRASAENSVANAQQSREHPQLKPGDALSPEEQEIVRRQEAAGIGAGIYSGQGGFTGSTDNLSISSTASSASMMLRKMGKGAKKGARSIKGLFRPKSVIGVPAIDSPREPLDINTSASAQPSMAQVSMVTVEAERQKVNVNAEPSERDGGTTYPKLERSSVDAQSARASADTGDSQRRSIVGSDKDRAEVLAAVRKGILKRTGTNSPHGSPSIRPIDTTVQQNNESPVSSMPSTPQDGQPGRTGSLTAPHDYFSTRLPSMARSAPNTPSGRNISFSPRIQFHDVWSATDYDRRGEIATCNRLTPMLAQQIKEELNTFKMEMEVHEQSKPHTHFF